MTNCLMTNYQMTNPIPPADFEADEEHEPPEVSLELISPNGTSVLKKISSFKSDLEMTLILQTRLEEAVSSAVLAFYNDDERALIVCQIEAYGGVSFICQCVVRRLSVHVT